MRTPKSTRSVSYSDACPKSRDSRPGKRPASRRTCSSSNGHAAREAQPFQGERRRLDLDPQCPGRVLAGRPDGAVDDPGRGLQALPTHLLGQAHDAQQRELDGRTDDEGAPATGPLQAPLTDQVGERPTHGDEAAAVFVRKVPLRGQSVTRLPLPGIEGTTQVQVHLVMQRHRTGLQATTRHGC